MLETLDRLVLAGLGAISMTRQRAQEIFEDAVRAGREERINQDRFVRDLMDSAKTARTDLENLISHQTREALKQISLATKEDIARVEAKLDTLLARPA